MVRKKNTKRISSSDVAKLAGVSQSAVSRAFTPGANISEKTRNKVLEAAQKLGYRPNVIAKSLAQQRTKLIGVMFLEFWNPFLANLLGELTQRVQDQGYRSLLFNISDEQTVEKALLTVLQYQVDGIIIEVEKLSRQLAHECVRMGTPVVFLNHYRQGSHVNVVCCDDEAGGRLAADVLLDTGCQRIAYISGREGSSSNIMRERGVVERLRERGYSLCFRETGNYRYESGCVAARRLLQSENPPDAIFCASDLMALGVIDVARHELGIRIPEELSVIGFDDIPMAGWIQYSLTTIRQPIDLLAETTINVLMSAIEHPDSELLIRLVPGKLVSRSSTRNLKNNKFVF